MRNAGRYAAMYRVYDRCDQMVKLCNDTANMLLTSEDVVIKDSLKEVVARLSIISHMASDAARDEFDFGANGSFLPYTIKRAVKDALIEEGLISDKAKDEKGNAS